MADLSFEVDWVESEGVPLSEHRCTWARLRILVDKTAVTRNYDSRSQTVREFVVLPLYPLAEWIATRWWYLHSETENPERRRARDFWERHCIAEAREGFALPALTLVPQGAYIRLQWGAEILPFSKTEFLSSGTATLDEKDVASVLADFLDLVSARLEESEVEGTLFQEEWQTIQAADSEERQFCIAAATAGMDCYALSAESAETLLEASRRLPPAVFSEMLQISREKSMASDAQELLALLDETDNGWLKVPTIGRLRGSFDVSKRQAHLTPWSIGFSCARQVREVLGIGSAPLPSLDALASALRVDRSGLEASYQQTSFRNSMLDGVLRDRGDGAIGMALKQRGREESTRFHYCRGLGAYLLGQEGSASLLTPSGSERQSLNRAFAAEFLVPSEGLREKKLSHTLEPEEVDALADEYGVSSYVVRHQLENHQIATVGSSF